MWTRYMNTSLHMNLSIDICELLHSKFQTNGKWEKLYNWTIEKKILIGEYILEWTKWNLKETTFKKIEVIWSVYRLKYLNGCFSRILLGQFLNILCHY